jgi:hypothetical protein
LNSDAYTDTLERLAAGGGPVVRNEMALSASRLAGSLVALPGSVASGEEALQPFDEDLDALLAPAVALIGLGPHETVHTASVALDILAAASAGSRRVHTAVATSMLARAALTMTASVLAWHRLEALAALASVTRSNGYGPAVSVLADTDLRHLDLFNRGADDSFRAHVAWFHSRPWRASVGPLSTAEQVSVAFAEADVLTGMLAVGTDPVHSLYAAGLSVPDRRVEERLVSRTRDARQRPLLCMLFDVADRELDQRLTDAYSNLTLGGFPTSYGGSLFAQ